MDKANEVLSRNLNRTNCGDAPRVEIQLINDGYGTENRAKDKAKFDVHILTCLLHYHERMTMGEVSMMKPDGTSMTIQSGTLFTGYAEALREAIRCIKEVHGIE